VTITISLIYKWKVNIRDNSSLIMMEMCWVISHFWLIYLIVKTLKIYEYVILSWIPKIKESTFFIIWGFSNGPLMVSILVYKTPLIFHNPKYVSSIAIHILPVALAWNLRWNAEKYEK